jgi:hypothetical protein
LVVRRRRKRERIILQPAYIPSTTENQPVAGRIWVHIMGYTYVRSTQLAGMKSNLGTEVSDA